MKSHGRRSSTSLLIRVANLSLSVSPGTTRIFIISKGGGLKGDNLERERNILL